MKHTRRPAALAAGILALALLLGGCAPAAALTSPSAAGRSPLDWPRPRQDGGQDWFDQWFGSWYGGSGLTQAQRMYGSAGLLSWPSVLVSVYLDEQNGAAWDEASIAESRETLAIAVDWRQLCRRHRLGRERRLLRRRL